MRAKALLLALILGAIAIPAMALPSDYDDGGYDDYGYDDEPQAEAEVPDYSACTPISVSHGDTLWDLLEEHGVSPTAWPEWAAKNGLRVRKTADPDMTIVYIYPGQELNPPETCVSTSSIYPRAGDDGPNEEDLGYGTEDGGGTANYDSGYSSGSSDYDHHSSSNSFFLIILIWWLIFGAGAAARRK